MSLVNELLYCDRCGNQLEQDQSGLCDDCLGRSVECGNCNWEGYEGWLNDISDYHDRVEPGFIAPAGQCPDCQGLAYLTDEEFAKVNGQLIHKPDKVYVVILEHGGIPDTTMVTTDEKQADEELRRLIVLNLDPLSEKERDEFEDSGYHMVEIDGEWYLHDSQDFSARIEVLPLLTGE